MRAWISLSAALLALFPASRAAAQLSAEESAEACRNGFDDDGDGASDCADEGCLAWSFCGPAAPPPAAASEDTPSACQDGIDNDADGAMDCADSECGALTACAGAAPPPPEEVAPPPPAAPVEASAEACRNGVDDDADGQPDCGDEDCRAGGFCPDAAPRLEAAPPPTGDAGEIMGAGSGLASSWDRIGRGPDLLDTPGEWRYAPVAIVRLLIMPAWELDIMDDFVPGYSPKDIVNVGVGGGFSFRVNDFELMPAIWWGSVSTEEREYARLGSYTNPYDGSVHYQDVAIDLSDFSFLVGSMSVLWNTPLTRWLTFAAGLSVGAAVTLGRPRLTTAVQDSTGQWVPCTEVYGPTCEEYASTHPWPIKVDAPNEDFWPVIPYLEGLVGFRFRIHRHFAVNLEGAFGVISSVGLRVMYVI